MRLKTRGLWVIAAPAVIVSLALGFYHLILDWHGRPVCHKLVMGAFTVWMMDNKQRNTFPNANGISQASLDLIRNEMGGSMDWAKDYRYIPGLREDDPGRLIIMYMNRPTRWTWHGAPPTVFKEKAWIVVPVNFDSAGPGELSERISTEDFKKRLAATIDFVRTNERPHWQTIVAEHTKFLESMENAQ